MDAAFQRYLSIQESCRYGGKRRIYEVIREELFGMMVHITIPLDPRSKKNSQKIIYPGGRPMIIPSKPYKAFEDACGKYLQDPTQIYYHLGLKAPCNVMCHYYMHTRRKVDLVNLQEATLDVLVKYGILEDDNSNIVKSMDGSRVFYCKEHPRTEIFIEWEE